MDPMLIERVAKEIAFADGEDFYEDAKRFRVLASAAIAEVRKADAEEKAAEGQRQNVAYLQANIAEMEKFAARSEENDDPIGAMQWYSRIEDFQRQLAEALSLSPAPSHLETRK